jgi:ribonuclease HII
MGKLLSYLEKGRIEAGCDEAGRGCLAGPVVAAAVVLPKDFAHDWLNDSKKLSHTKRMHLKEIIENEALAYAVEFVFEREIETINILNASITGMKRAADRLAIQPEHLLIDGNRFHPGKIPHTCIIKGDGKFMSIAAASILAKTYRDEYMVALHGDFPYYQWDINKGYPTLKHRKALKEFGPSIHHRMTFNLLPPEQMTLF